MAGAVDRWAASGTVLALRARPSRVAGLAAAAAALAVTTALVYPLKEVAPTISAGVIYLIPVLLVSIFWGLWLGLGTAVGGTLAFNFFHIDPTGLFTVTDAENLVALSAFLIAAAITSTLADLVRGQAIEADRRRLEADITADLTRTLLGGPGIKAALPAASRRLAEDLGVAAAELSLDSGADADSAGIPLDLGGGRVGRLELSPDLDDQAEEWIRARVAPATEAVLRAAIERDDLQEVAIESRALRRSDVLKTALIRSVSHDLRSPLAAIVTSGEALRSPGLTPAEREEMTAAVISEARRLARLVDNLLDLSRLESGVAAPQPDWCDPEEVVESAADQARRASPAAPVRTKVEAGVGLLRVDPNQIERALVNLIENAQRYSAPEPVTVGLRGDRGNAVIRIVDHGPGIAGPDLERIFDPFVRLGEDDGHPGSGLGLAIARGFVEANGGTIRAESLPGQGAAFTIELPGPDGEGR